MVIGFTGTQQGMTQAQKDAVLSLLNEFKLSLNLTVHHGECIGADADFHDLAGRVNARRVLHPPTDKSKCANLKFYDEKLPDKPYLDRNYDIARDCDVLIATPKEDTEQLRSGTWATVRYARKLSKQLIIILPNGKVM